MPLLNSAQRDHLEKAVIKARKISVRGAHKTLKAFAVDHKEPYSHMGANERELRNQLRRKARLLGDNTTQDGGHTINKLSYELAYEYWHQMLFAKFLEANNFLRHPDHEISVSMEECEELGQEEGFEDKWDAAASYASKMLPAIFRQDDPLLQLKYATEDRLALEEIIESISEEVFRADDSLGWVYQYWQTKEKERINEEGNKIDGDSISAVTQLFTEPYMVHFLIDNTLGAWWTARNPGITSPYEFKYLRTNNDGSPAAGSFDGWPETLREITMLDPCMGSGHFVVDVFMVMATLRMHEEGLSKAQACDAVIKDNLHGLELDPRCTQIAAFNLALTAWKFCEEYRILPEMNLACCGIAPTGKKEDWVKLANSEPDAEKRTRLKGGLERMYDLFQQAPELGSLIDPKSIEKDAFTSDFEELQPYLEEALKGENGEIANERAVIAAGIAKAGTLLAKRYIWQITNVPYLSRGKQDQVLYDFCEENYPKSKNDLATVFYEKMLRCNTEGGSSCSVIPQNWLFLTTYRHFRKELLQNCRWDIVARLGPKGFSTPMWDFNVMLISITNQNTNEEYRLAGLDVSEYESASEKDKALRIVDPVFVSQFGQIENLDSSIVLDFSNQVDLPLLSKYTDFYSGLQTGDGNKLMFYFWEFNHSKFDKIQRADGIKAIYSSLSYVTPYLEGHGLLAKEPGSVLRNINQNVKKGIVIHRMGELVPNIYHKSLVHENGVLLEIKEESHFKAIWSYVSSSSFNREVRKLNQKLSVTPKVFNQVPFELEHWQKVAEENYPDGLPKPYSDDPTQWIFHGHPMYTELPLQVAFARLMGYEWPAENDKEMELSDDAREKIKAIKQLELPFDKDGIVCIPAVNGEPSASDRIRENIISIWGQNYSSSTLSDLIGQEGSKKRDLESYLREDYFAQHCKLFKNRPFIWHIWDGRKDGFAALVNYHKLDRATLEKLIYTYLGDWINQCELKMQNNVSGADGLLSAAKDLKKNLVLILEGEPPYDLFIRWKSLEEQPIGWDPDINDGVRLNVYPFVKAGVLRKNFNVKWGKDRGKNPSGSYWGPDRWNRYEDLDDAWKLKDEHKNILPHLTTEIKRKARK